MEEYRDLQLTVDVFLEVLAEPEFLSLRAGIVLQAYLPDSYPIQQQLTQWARERVARGGSTIKIRLVKGANLAMERVDAEVHLWSLAPYPSKEEVDANYKRMVRYGLDPENSQAANIGIASHNLFDLAYALVLHQKHDLGKSVDFEMLTGMAPPQARAILAEAGQLLFYTPIVHRDDFEASIAYLVRRLDENTTPGNFLRDLFQIANNPISWDNQRKAFLRSFEQIETLATGPNRQQNRSAEAPVHQNGVFTNCPDTDFSLVANQQWLDAILASPEEDQGDPPLTKESVENAIQTAKTSSWPQTTLAERKQLLRQAAVEIAHSRSSLLVTMAREGKKAPHEADAEISEAIDFANYYATSFEGSEWSDGLEATPLGTVVVASPWNFPCAIPCGGTLAALVAGNPVILKPAPEAIATARCLVAALWKAGFPADALQFLPLPDNELGRSLITDERIAAVILTGAAQTADRFLDWRPQLRLFAETSGKNSLIISASADPDLAIKDLVKSAFGHSGQKCSAASLAIVERSLLEKTNFLERLKEAASSLAVGPSSRRNSIVTPTIQTPIDDLLRGLTQLDEGESWLLEPQGDPSDPCLWSPGIRLGVKEGSWLRKTELFGPVLGIIAYDSLEDAIRIQNATEFGLTGGLHSLDSEERDYWEDNVETGNAYLNRTITGAIVQRQPFGGWKKSAVGPGAKAGGPNYVPQLTRLQSPELPQLSAPLSDEIANLLENLSPLLSQSDFATVTAAAKNASYWWNEHFSKDHDPSGLQAERNTFRYRRISETLFRIDATSTLLEISISLLMASTAKVAFSLSDAQQSPPEILNLAKLLDIPLTRESDKELKERISQSSLSTLRTPRSPSTNLAYRNHHQPVTPHARYELLPYFLEQSVSETRHRHGRMNTSR
jgi:RHH-type proline utilization regulon transcriptional repressor/proline dehydrogenase/delta 1-pyrroline-5-carboxylate dehydrogenase